MPARKHYHRMAVQSLLASALILPSFYSVSGDVDGRSIAFACSACHGTDGAVNKPGLPLLKAQDEKDMAKSLLDYKYDRSRSTVMGRIAKGYTDKELESVATYFATRK